MSRKRVLCITARDASAYSVAPGRLIEEGTFAADEEGLASFSGYLQRHRDSVFYLLGDVPEEDFQQENIPYVTGPDRAALIARKLGQTFRDTKLSLAISLGREPGARRDERVLFAAFSNTQFFHPWLKALHGHEIRMAGVYSIALVGNALIRKLALKDQRVLVISLHRSGVRQNYFEGGRIRFSRLTQSTETDARRSAEACVVESGKIQQYLEGLRLIQREGPPLKVLVIAPQHQYGVFSEVCVGSQRMHFEVVDEQAVAAKVGLRSVPGGNHAEALFCYLLGMRAPAEQYAPKTQRRMFRLWQLRNAILGVSGAIFAGCVLFASAQVYQVLELRGKMAAAKTQAAQDARRYDEVRKTFPPMPTTTENLKATVQRFDEIERGAASPEQMLVEISKVLDAFTSVELDRIDWAVTRGSADIALGDAAKPAAPAAPSAPAQAAAQDKSLYQVALLAGRVQTPNRLDYRGMLDYLDQFAGALRKYPDTRVELVKLPFDIRSGAKLSGGVSTEQPPQATAFALRMSRKI